MRALVVLGFVATFVAGAGAGYWGAQVRRAGAERAVASGGALFDLDAGRAAHGEVPTAEGPPITVGRSAVTLRFDRCAVAALRNESGRFTGRGRWVAPTHVLRPERLHVVVVEAVRCDPCERLLSHLAIEHLGLGVDLVALGIGDDSGAHAPVGALLQAGAGWLYVGGFDEHALLEGVFARAATPSTLIVDGEGNILAGMQGLPDGDPARVVAWLHEQLTAIGVRPGRDQALVSPDLHLPHDPRCEPPVVARDDENVGPRRPTAPTTPGAATRPSAEPVAPVDDSAAASPATGPEPGAAAAPPATGPEPGPDAPTDAPVDDPAATSVAVARPPAATDPPLASAASRTTSPAAVAPAPVPPPSPPPPPLPARPADAAVDAVIAQLRKRSVACFGKDQKARDLALTFAISAAGYARDVDVQRTPSKKASECATRILGTLRFPRSQHGVKKRKVTLEAR